MKIIKYTNENDKIRYKFNIYFGKDLITRKEIRTNKQDFKTKHKAELAYVNAEQTYRNRNRMAFEQVYNLWKEIYKYTVKESTYKTITDLFRLHILPIFGNALIEKISFMSFLLVILPNRYQCIYLF